MLDFFRFFMPAIHNDLESAKYQADQGNYNRAHQCLDEMEKRLNQVREQTEEEIKRRDNK
jgi:tetrahydromethanopterin S-methyltransferase subunit G